MRAIQLVPPKSGERIVGRANLRAMREAYPARLALTIRQIRGSGEFWVGENLISYNDDKPLTTVNILEFRDGKVARETIYFGDPWDPPAWRARWVESVE